MFLSYFKAISSKAISSYEQSLYGKFPCFSMNNSDWMRIGAFFFGSSEALLMEKLIYPVKLPREDQVKEMLQLFGTCVLKNIKTGIWIAGMS